MSKDDRALVEVLNAELDFVEKGGYGRSVRTPWHETVPFQDSPACLQFPDNTHDDSCVLMQFVPVESRSQSVPCHHIPLNDAGETADSIRRRGNQDELETALKGWIKSRLQELETKPHVH